MEITIGMQNVARELTIETDATAEAVAEGVRAALEAGTPLEFTDTRGRRILVPASVVGYVEVGDEARKVGFHNL